MKRPPAPSITALHTCSFFLFTKQANLLCMVLEVVINNMVYLQVSIVMQVFYQFQKLGRSLYILHLLIQHILYAHFHALIQVTHHPLLLYIVCTVNPVYLFFSFSLRVVVDQARRRHQLSLNHLCRNTILPFFQFPATNPVRNSHFLRN